MIDIHIHYVKSNREIASAVYREHYRSTVGRPILNTCIISGLIISWQRSHLLSVGKLTVACTVFCPDSG
jgi:hypothetical protein